jgi:CheY-like chemotaxis protein
MKKQPINILMAEDNYHDIIATKRAWRKNRITNPLYIVHNGEECLDYLYHRGIYSDRTKAPTPGILLLDIQMPKINGLTVLKQIREDNKWRHLPVIILTTSELEEDRLRSYNLGATAYIRKPIGFSHFSAAVKAINIFWELVELPS